MTRYKCYYFIPLILQKIGYCLFWILFKIFVRLEIRGEKKLADLKGPVILAANHTSELDVTAMPLLLPFFSHLNPIHFIMNEKKKFKNPNRFGLRSYIYCTSFLELLGGVPVVSGHKNYAIALSNHVALLRKNRTLCVFPEGRITGNGHTEPAHGGLGYLLYSSRGAKVVPIAINTFYKMSWKEFWFLKRRKVTITVGEPLKAEDLILPYITEPTVPDCRAASQKVLDKISRLKG
ncbi:MAG: 1-acyl-sn-glycerol-3-phosphate acyltransferase [Candidatus Zambryskibacteria bacterium]|nr:1-acyl-sn-glycerol-3-phosphate acyltransferase [Candidatus Zambryskibacteria bacterium]